MDQSPTAAEHFLARQSCPYFQDGRPALSEHIRFRNMIDRTLPTSLIQHGWRRYGADLYRMRCENCELCIPLRINASKLFISESMRRILRLNSDVVIVPQEACFSEDHLKLWREYSIWKHLSSPEDLDEESYRELSVPGSIIFEYRKGSSEGDLLAISHVDPLPDGLSSVYFSFSPNAESRSLGYFSVLAESRIAQEYSIGVELSLLQTSGESIIKFYSSARNALHSSFYYLGFWVPGAVKMDYKARFRPFSLLLRGENNGLPQPWFTFDTRVKAMNFLHTVHWPGL